MADTCYCGCGREVTGEDLELARSGQNIREILDVLRNLSLPLSQEIPEAKEKITGLISHGERFDELMAGMIHGTMEPPGGTAAQQLSAWLATAGSVADAHMRLLGRTRKGAGPGAAGGGAKGENGKHRG